MKYSLTSTLTSTLTSFLLAGVALSALAHSQTSQTKDQHPPLVVGPVSLNCIAKPCSALFSVDGLGNIAGSSLYLGSVQLNGDPTIGSVDVGNLANSSATPYAKYVYVCIATNTWKRSALSSF
jgi:hypothetical protein